jgi:hypothetical protein
VKRAATFLVCFALIAPGCNCSGKATQLMTPDGGVHDGAIDAQSTDGVVAPDSSLDAEVGDALDAMPPTDAMPFDGTPGDVGMCSAPIDPAPPCPGMCGNGVRDMCSMCTPPPCRGGGLGADAGPPSLDGGACCTMQAEACDGTDLAGATCASLGFAAGTLSCGSSCAYDTSRCTVCAPMTPHVAECVEPTLEGEAVTAIALAASDQAVAVAWIDGPNLGGAGGLHFDLYTPDLVPISRSGCMMGVDAERVALAAMPNGWMLAVQTHAGIAVSPLDLAGTSVGSHTLYPGLAIPILAPVPSDAPLLVGVDSHGAVIATWLDATSAMRSQAMVFPSSVEPQYGSAVFVNGPPGCQAVFCGPQGFLVAMRGLTGVQIAKLGIQGGVAMVNPPVGSSTEYPQLAWDEAGTITGRLTWADFSGTATMRWASITQGGQIMGTPVALGAIPNYYDPAPLVVLPAPMPGLNGGDSMILMPGYSGVTDGATHLDYERLSPDGTQVIVPPTRLTTDPHLATMYQIVRSGSGAVAAWISGPSILGGGNFQNRIVLEKITP